MARSVCPHGFFVQEGPVEPIPLALRRPEKPATPLALRDLAKEKGGRNASVAMTKTSPVANRCELGAVAATSTRR